MFSSNETYKQKIEELDNELLIEYGKNVEAGKYVCPLCFEIVYVYSDINKLPTCSKCGYNLLHNYANVHR